MANSPRSKMKQAVLSKCIGRAFSSVSSFSLTSKQKTLGLWGAFAEYRKRKVFWDRVIKMHDEYCKQRQDQWDRLSKLRQTLNICIPNSPSSFVKVYWKSVFDRLFFLLNVKAENFGTLGSLCRWILYPFLHKVPKENRVDRMHKEYHTRRQELRERVSEVLGDQD